MNLDTICFIIIFCFILFIYLHVQFHLKICNDLEIYNFDSVLNYDLNELDKLRQPMIFMEISDDILLKFSSVYNMPPDAKFKVDNHKMTLSELKDSPFYSLEYGNMTFYKQHYMKYDNVLKPMGAFQEYDIWTGHNSIVPLRYMFFCRFFIVPVDKPISVKLTSPDNSNRLHPNENYIDYEFTSDENPWQSEISVKFLEVTVNPGQYLFVPSYWWFSVRFNELTNVVCFKYDTIMNSIANIKNHLLHASHIASNKNILFNDRSVKNKKILERSKIKNKQK